MNILQRHLRVRSDNGILKRNGSWNFLIRSWLFLCGGLDARQPFTCLLLQRWLTTFNLLHDPLWFGLRFFKLFEMPINDLKILIGIVWITLLKSLKELVKISNLAWKHNIPFFVIKEVLHVFIIIIQCFDSFKYIICHCTSSQVLKPLAGIINSRLLAVFANHLRAYAISH